MTNERRLARTPLRGGESLRNGLKDKGRKRRNDLADIKASGPGALRNDILPKLELVHLSPIELTAPARNVRTIDPVQIRRIMNSITTVGFIAPVLIDQDNAILNGVAAAEAAKALGLAVIPCIRVSHLTAIEKRIVRLALNRLAEKGRWALPELKVELIELVDEGIEIEDTAFSLAEFDQITLDDEIEPAEQGPLAPECEAPAVARLGDVFIFDGGHRVVCGDATDPEVHRRLPWR
jgi:hypothetical protein